jgi:hypothetical protein
MATVHRAPGKVLGLTVTVGAQELEVLQPVVVPITVYVMKRER